MSVAESACSCFEHPTSAGTSAIAKVTGARTNLPCSTNNTSQKLRLVKTRDRPQETFQSQHKSFGVSAQRRLAACTLHAHFLKLPVSTRCAPEAFTAATVAMLSRGGLQLLQQCSLSGPPAFRVLMLIVTMRSLTLGSKDARTHNTKAPLGLVRGRSS